MDVMMISSMHTYTKNMSMQMKWQQKKASGNYGADKKNSSVSGNPWKKEQTEGTEYPTKTSDSAKELGKIRTKLNTGKRLTSDEMAYLEEHDPQLYKQAKTLEMERQAYEQELKRCKTKEDVQRLKMSHAASSLSAVNEIKNDPNIPSGAKLGLIVQEHCKFSSIEAATQEFIDSGRYSKLPSEQEQHKAEKEMEEARKAEQNIADKMDDIEVLAEEKAEEEQPAKAAEGLGERKAEDVVLESKKSRIEAEVTPEARKVRWAKAQAAYAQVEISTQSAVSMVDIKVE
ncbi:MAG: hypothetical protein HFG65_13860 [Hungatella sp.]|nr:hypothetical protein [Hungatella sp.]